ncbi:related to PalC protein [Cephalotrichum gorgonifer]|uniref:pH-response regulator protein palC n=1 Tax=Cephalotrichum gorgonifer TaxID=2041049 RepID=A0AAE8MQB0_9PEZI|nr:related to PalC protein [Cephalotrichum gorgonifer]
MPFPFTLPTTSAFSFSSTYTSPSHPSLPLTASTYRGVVRDALKKHKRLPPASRAPNVPSLVSSLTAYLPYLLAIDAGLRDDAAIADLRVSPKSTAPPSIEWRPTLSDPGVRTALEAPRAKLDDLDHEIAFVLLTLASCHSLLARAALHPLYDTSAAFSTPEERTTAIQVATRSLLAAAPIYEYAASRADNTASRPPCADVAPPTARGLAALAVAEATLLAVLKDDPYPAAVAQDRNKQDKEWMYKAPEIAKVRAHLFARLCLAAADHAARAAALLRSAAPGKIDAELVRYVEDLRRTSRAKACRFFGIDAELGGQMGTAIAWLNAGLGELGIEARDDGGGRKGFAGLSRLKREWSEKREDRRVEKETAWGADGGRAEEGRVIQMLSEKWNKVNDTVGTQVIPPVGPLLAKMPAGREIHGNIPPFSPPVLDRDALDAIRAPPDRSDDFGDLQSSDDEDRASEKTVVGAFPGDYSRSGSTSTGYY